MRIRDLHRCSVTRRGQQRSASKSQPPCKADPHLVIPPCVPAKQGTQPVHEVPVTSLAFKLRDYRSSDAEEMAQLYYESARTLGRRRYTDAQVAAWAPAPTEPDAVRNRAGDGRSTIVAVDDENRVIGYGDLEPDGHVDHLYCHPLAAGRGVAQAILDAILERARQGKVSRLYVEASELARSLFERNSFVVTERRDFQVRGTPIHNFAMERHL